MLFLFPFFSGKKSVLSQSVCFKKKLDTLPASPFTRFFFEPQILRHSLLRTNEYVKFLVCVCVSMYIKICIYIDIFT